MYLAPWLRVGKRMCPGDLRRGRRGHGKGMDVELSRFRGRRKGETRVRNQGEREARGGPPGSWTSEADQIGCGRGGEVGPASLGAEVPGRYMPVHVSC